jgi:uncharacterized membrane protein
MMTWALPLLIGVVAGLRSMTAPAAVSWAAGLGWLQLTPTRLAFLASPYTHWIFSALAVGELIVDQLPGTPSRTAPAGFGARLVSGALCGAAVGAHSGMLGLGLVMGVAGAIVGTLGGLAVRLRLAHAFGHDRPAALIEDIVAIGGSILMVLALPR